MKKIGLLVLSAALLMSCGAQTPSSSSASKTESSQSEATSSMSTAPVESSEPISSSEPVVSSEISSEVSSEASSEISSEVSSEISSEVSSEISSEVSSVEPNDGSADHPFTVTEAYNIAATLAAGANTDAGYCISGVVNGDVSWYKGRLSFNITDGEQVLYVYNMNNEENKASYKEGEFDLKEGDAITVTGALKNYNGTLEICYVKNVADCYRIA